MSRLPPPSSARPSAFAEVTNDSVGSTVAKVPGTGGGRSVAIVGHIDEIGLIVHHIDDDGYLWFTGVGWDPVILVGQQVEIATRDGVVLGVVGKKPIHLLKTEEDRRKAPGSRACTSTSARRTATTRARSCGSATSR